MRTALDRLYTAAGALAGLFLVAIGVLVLLSILTRLMGLYVPGLSAYAGYAMAGASFLALAYTFGSGGHIRVALFIDKFTGKVRRGAELWCLAVGSFLSGYLAWFSVKMVQVSYQLGDVSEGADATPLWIPQIAMALGAVLLLACLRGIENRIHPREATSLIGHERAEHALLEAYRSGRLAHAWLIAGPRGIGKATLAYRFARFVLSQPSEPESLAIPSGNPVFQRVAGVMGQHEDVAVIGRDIAPPAFPAGVLPGAAFVGEHVAAHDPCADVAEPARGEALVLARGAAILADHRLKGPGADEPGVQRPAVFAHRGFEALARPGAVTVGRDRVAFYAEAGHGSAPFV